VGAGVGRDLPRPRRVGREDVETEVAAQREPHRDDASCLDDANGWEVVHGAKEAVEGVEGPDREGPCGEVRRAKRVGHGVGNGVASNLRRDDSENAEGEVRSATCLLQYTNGATI
jgi:hypothetical protein